MSGGINKRIVGRILLLTPIENIVDFNQKFIVYLKQNS
jgi:hypothetical protein